jgi:DNA polymerase-3 subunit epsilon
VNYCQLETFHLGSNKPKRSGVGVEVEFIAIDFETANAKRASLCSVGLVHVKNGEAVDSLYSLIKPPSGFDNFEPINIGIHGITPEMIKGEPSFDEFWPRMEQFIGGLPLVAHNAPFDMGVLRETFRVFGISPNPITYFCTMVLSRQLLDILSYRLPYVTEELGLDGFDHHDALEDAFAASRIAVELGKRAGFNDLYELAASVRVRPGLLDETGTSGTSAYKRGKAVSYRRGEINELMSKVDMDSVNQGGPCFDKEFIFTGALSHMTRKEAQEEVIERGGRTGSSVTKKTNFLVFGSTEAVHLKPGAEFSSKYVKALSEREKRSDIEVIDEETFLGMLDS